MLNTCSIGRRWKSREGWSRPVLTGERGTLFPIPLGDWVSSCGGFLVGWQGTLFLVVAMTILVRRLICLRPLSGSRTATTGIGRVAGSVAGRSVWSAVQSGFAVVMAQVRRPVPFRTRKLRPGTAMVLHSRGCGRVARRRIQRWGFPSSFGSGNPLFLFVVPARRPEPIAPGVPVGPFPLLGVRIIPRAGRSRTPRDFRNFRGASCAYPMVE